MKRSAQLIIPGGYGDPYRQAAARPYDPAGQPAPINPMPRLASPNIIRASDGRLIRRGTVVGGSSTFSGVSGTSAQSVAQSPLFYDYRWSTPDKFYFPRNRVVANSIWREIYKRDALVAAATDVFAELPWSKFDLVGMEDSGIRKVYEDMFNSLNILPKLPGFARDFLITGELILHTLFDSSKGFWNRVIPHNPDYIRAEGIGLIMDQPLLWLRPTPEIRRLLTSPDPRVRKLQKLLPKELLSSFRMNREVPLDALNTTFIPRLNNSTDIRGTSIYTRLFRIVMYEDFLVNASLAVAQRNAVPLRLFKLGDPNTGWLPSEEDEAALAEMLSMAEADPLAAIIMHHNVQVELVGVSDRALLVSKEWDFIERVKLVALGMAKSFLLGETSFASAVAGLQTLLERLSSLRGRFEHDWIIKKLCEPLAKMHGFYKRTQSELDNRIRVKRSEEEVPLVPELKWRKSLEPTQDASILGVWRDLKERGILSDRTYASGAGLDLNIERDNKKEEQQFIRDNPAMFGMVPAPEGGAGGGVGGGGGGMGGLPKGGPAVKPPAPEMPGLPAPPALPGGSYHKKTGNRNPYKKYDDIIDELEERADKTGMIDVRDAIEVVSNAKQESEEESLEGIPPGIIQPAGKNLLSGE